MKGYPDDKTLYEMFEQQGEQMLSDSLMPHFEEDIHDLVKGVKDVIELTLSMNPDADVDTKRQVANKLEIWKKTKEKHLAYSKYLEFVKENKLTDKILSFQRFADKYRYPRWKRIEELGIKKGSVIKIKGRGDLYTVKGISAYLSIAVKEDTKHFLPEEVISVVKDY